MDLISIISVNYNQPEVTVQFLKSIKNNANYDNVEVIIVDNGSREDHKQKFTEEYPGLIYIRSEENLGFAGGNNLGIKYAKGEFFLFLNNDTEITDNLLFELNKILDNDPSVGIVSPLILYYYSPEIIQYAGFSPMNYITCRNNIVGGMDLNVGQYDNISNETSFCHGAAMMCRKSDLEVTGLMPENYFLYYEEFDWCERFKKSGKKIWFTGRTSVLHKESISVGKESSIKTYFMTRNRILFIRRNTSVLITALFLAYYIIIACPKQIYVQIKKGRKDLIKWTIKGVVWNIINSTDSNNLGFKIK